MIVPPSAIPKQFKSINEKIRLEQNAYIDRLVNQQQTLVEKDAVIAVAHTRQVLLSLKKTNVGAAKKQLDKVLARLNQLASMKAEQDVAVIQISKMVSDHLIDPLNIKNKKQIIDAQWQLGHAQIVRRLLNNFANDIVMTTQSISTLDFIRTIKQIRSLIARDQTDEARRLTEGLLKSGKQAEFVIPLPLLRAELMIKEAERLTQQGIDNQQSSHAQLQWLLDNANYQLHLSEVFGYGEPGHYKMFYQAIDGIKNLIKADQQITALLSQLSSVIMRQKNEVIDELSKLPYN